MYNRSTGCCGCVIYHLFSTCQGNSNSFEHKNAPQQCWEGCKKFFCCSFTRSPPPPSPTLVRCIFVLKIITVALTDTKYMICNTPTTPSTCPANSSYIHATIP